MPNNDPSDERVMFGISFSDDTDTLAETGAIAETAEGAAEWAKPFLGRLISEALAESPKTLDQTMPDENLAGRRIHFAVVEPGRVGGSGRWLETLEPIQTISHEEVNMVPDTNDPIVTPQGVAYHQWTDGYAVGFRVVNDDGRVEYVYLNPSSDCGDDGQPNVFLYHGTSADQMNDEPVCYVDVMQAGDKDA